MSPSAPDVELLQPEVESRLIEFSRACRAAATMVSLYPSGHPAIRGALTRLATIGSRVTATGPLALTVLPDSLLVNGAALSRPDRPTRELAALLHSHSVGNLVLHGGADPDSWRTFLLLLARHPEEIRAEGGIRELWAKASSPSIDVQEVDYSEVLRERARGRTASLTEILINGLNSSGASISDEHVAALMEVVADPERLKELCAGLQSGTAPGGVTRQSAAFMNVLRRVAEHSAGQDPAMLDGVLSNMAREAANLAPDVLSNVLEQRGTSAATVGSLDVVSEIVQRMDVDALASFVSRAITSDDGGAVARLATALRTLVPEGADQHAVLKAAATLAAAQGEADAQFDQRLAQLEEMLSTYSDAKAVSRDYARELMAASSGPDDDVEQLTDDPPERIAAWMATVNDSALRGLDLQILLDLLRIEPELFKWREILRVVVAQVENLAFVGHVALVGGLVEAIAASADENDQSGRRPFALEALAQLASGNLMRQMVTHLRAGEEADYQVAATLCQQIGPAVVPAIAEALALEQDERSRQRLTRVVVDFGVQGREAVQALMNAENWEVRRAAAYLLRECGGGGTLPAMEALLQDSEPLVRREAIRTIALVGDERTYAVLVTTLLSGSSRVRGSLAHELANQTDVRMAPLYCYLVRHLAAHTAVTPIYVSAIETLGAIGGPDAVAVLQQALMSGEWWRPFRTHEIRIAAARALQRMGTPAASEALRAAESSGRFGLRRAIRAAQERKR